MLYRVASQSNSAAPGNYHRRTPDSSFVRRDSIPRALKTMGTAAILNYRNNVPRISTSGKWLTLTQRLDELRNLSVDWNSYGAEPPDESVLEFTQRVLEAASVFGRFNSTTVDVVPSVEGGAAVVFMKDARYADIELFNDGEIYFLTSDGTIQEVEPVALDDIERTLEHIDAFLQG